MRAVFRAKYNCHSDALFQLSRVTRVEDIFALESLKIMYQFKNGILAPALKSEIKAHTKIEHPKTRNQKSEANYSIIGLRKNDLFYEMIDTWNKSSIDIKERTYSMSSVKERIKYALRNKNEFICQRKKCFSCFATNIIGLENYMKL